MDKYFISDCISKNGEIHSAITKHPFGVYLILHKYLDVAAHTSHQILEQSDKYV